MTYKDEFNKFSHFDDDKPNDHIDLSKRTTISLSLDASHIRASKSKEKFSRRSTHLRNNANKHGHSNFPPFGIIKKSMIRTNK